MSVKKWRLIRSGSALSIPGLRPCSRLRSMTLFCWEGPCPPCLSPRSASTTRLFPPPHKVTFSGHGRIETQTIRVTRFNKTGKTRKETARGVTSLSSAQASPHELLDFVRGHWEIENRLPWVPGHRLPGRDLHDPDRKQSPCHLHSPEYDHQSAESRRLEIHCPGPGCVFQQVVPDLPLSRPLTKNVTPLNVFLHTRQEGDLRLFAGLFFLIARHCPFGKRQSVKKFSSRASFLGVLLSEASLSPDFDGDLLKKKNEGRAIL